MNLQFYIPTLTRTWWREVASLVSLTAFGVPKEQIHFYHGHDGNDYETPEQMKAEATKTWKITLDEKWGRGDIGCYWSYLDCLMMFVDSTHDYCFFTQDDRACFSISENHHRLEFDVSFHPLLKRKDYYKVTRPYPDLCEQISRLLEIDPDMKVFQAFWYGELDREYDRLEKKLPIKRGVHASGESGLVLSKTGAKEIIDGMIKHKTWYEHFWMKPEFQGDHYYSTLTSWRFMREIDYRIEKYAGGDVTDIPGFIPSIAAQNRNKLNYEDYQEGNINFMENSALKAIKRYENG